MTFRKFIVSERDKLSSQRVDYIIGTAETNCHLTIERLGYHGYILEMGQYKLQEYQCIMLKVSRCGNISLLKSIRSSSIYDY